MSTHTLVVEIDAPYAEKFGHLHESSDPDLLTWRIECSDPAACPGWIECEDAHADAPDPDDQAEVEMHGVHHEWRWGHGWTVEYDGCPVADFAVEGADPPDGWGERGIGRYVIDADWDDEWCTLTFADGAEA